MKEHFFDSSSLHGLSPTHKFNNIAERKTTEGGKSDNLSVPERRGNVIQSQEPARTNGLPRADTREGPVAARAGNDRERPGRNDNQARTESQRNSQAPGRDNRRS